MIVIDGIKFKDYKEVCDYFGIDYEEFEKFRRVNYRMHEYDLLKTFIPNLKSRFADYSYITREEWYIQ